MHWTTMNKAVAVFTILYLPKISHGDCSREGWSHIPGEKYIKAFKDRKAHDEANKKCHELGGQLLIIRNDEIQKSVEQYFQSTRMCDHVFHIGIKGEANLVKWIDGTVPEYQNWDHVPRLNNYCGGVEWCSKRTWSQVDCNSGRFFVCEALVPCSSRPMLSIDGEKGLENKIVNVVEEKDVSIKCFLAGYSDKVREVILFCNDDRLGRHRTSVTESFQLNSKSSSNKCICQSSLTDGRKEESYIQFVFQSGPVLVTHNNATTVHEGQNAKVVFEIVAIPQPFAYTLKKNGRQVENSNYVTNVERLESKPFNRKVTMKLTHLVVNSTGVYNIIIKNGVPEDLDFTFHLTVLPRKRKQSPAFGSLLIFLGVTVSFMLLIGFVFLIIIHQALKKEVSNESDHDQNEEEHSHSLAQSNDDTPSHNDTQSHDDSHTISQSPTEGHSNHPDEDDDDVGNDDDHSDHHDNDGSVYDGDDYSINSDID